MVIRDEGVGLNQDDCLSAHCVRAFNELNGSLLQNDLQRERVPWQNILRVERKHDIVQNVGLYCASLRPMHLQIEYSLWG